MGRWSVGLVTRERTTQMSDSVTIAVLSGGQSRRMGTDKSFLLLRGKPLLQHVIDRVRQLNCEIILIANDVERYRSFELPTYPDVIPNTGSLGGLYSALVHSSTDWTLCLACDMPQVNPTLLRYLISLRADYDAVVPRTGGVLQALHALYHQRCASVIREHLQQRQLKISQVIELLSVCFVDDDELCRIDPENHSFINLNTPSDFAQFEQIQESRS